MYDIATNPDAWTKTDEVLEIPNPWAYFWQWSAPDTILVPVYQKIEDGETYRMGFYRDAKHVLGFSVS